MKKKIVLTAVIAILVALCTLCVVFYIKNQKAQVLIEQVPDIVLQTTDGQTANLVEITRDNVSVIFFFHPQCSFCAMEMKEILSHQTELENVCLVFVTTAEGEELSQFLEEYPISTMPHSTVLIDHNRDFVLTFNVKSPPTCYVYDKHQNLLKTLRGTTPVSKIIKTLDNLR